MGAGMLCRNQHVHLVLNNVSLHFIPRPLVFRYVIAHDSGKDKRGLGCTALDHHDVEPRTSVRSLPKAKDLVLTVFRGDEQLADWQLASSKIAALVGLPRIDHR